MLMQTIHAIIFSSSLIVIICMVYFVVNRVNIEHVMENVHNETLILLSFFFTP